jgi:hypothetical protein
LTSAGRSADVSEKHHSSFNRDAIVTPCTIIGYTHFRPEATPQRCVTETLRGSETEWIEAIPENLVPLTPFPTKAYNRLAVFAGLFWSFGMTLALQA